MDETELIEEIIRKRLTELSGSCQSDDIPLDEKSLKIVMWFAEDLAKTLVKNGIGKVEPYKLEAEYWEKAYYTNKVNFAEFIKGVANRLSRVQKERDDAIKKLKKYPD